MKNFIEVTNSASGRKEFISVGSIVRIAPTKDNKTFIQLLGNINNTIDAYEAYHDVKKMITG